ncbi:MAG: hypothetical protein ABIK65_00160 [Candidatus Eisenbacteria bacterium]
MSSLENPPRNAAGTFRRNDNTAVFACLFLVLTISGCGVNRLEKRREGYRAFYEGNPDGAAELLAKAEHKKDRLLFALDRGLIAHTLGRPDESNAAFAEAERIFAEVDVRDVTDEAASLLVNDYSIEYKGEDFEKVLVHPFKALNYLTLEQPSEALVECRALNEKLVELQEKYERKSVYSEDAFARYLSGVIYESAGNKNDALVDCRLAVSAFDKHEEWYGTPFPPSLRESVLRLAEAQGLSHVMKEFRERWPDQTWTPYDDRKELGELVLVLENGQAPVKESARFDVAIGGQLYSVSFPTYRAIPPEAVYGVFRAGEGSARTEIVGDVSAIAVKDLEDRYHRVIAKQAARLLVKHVEVDKVKKENWLLGTVLNLVNSANEQADLRSWETLPGSFQMARLTLPPGYYDRSTLELYGKGGRIVDTVDLGPWEVVAGRTRFLYYRTLR